MKIELNHPNGNVWVPARKSVDGVECFVLSNKNVGGHLNAEGAKDRSNRERFEIYVPDERSLLNGLQSGLSKRMRGIGDNGTMQTNLFDPDGLTFDGMPLARVSPKAKA
jgi:hypothetical protein